MVSENIFPKRDIFIDKEQKEVLLKQKGMVIWFTGLSCSGKSSLALELEKKLFEKGHLTEVLDGDKIRNGLSGDLGFEAQDRNENIRRIAEVSRLFCHAGVITISAFISPTKEMRDMAREIVGAEDFYEVYVSTPIEVCEQRDAKGLYKKARAGEILNFTGVSAPYEAPEAPAVDMNTEGKSIEECVTFIYTKLFGE